MLRNYSHIAKNERQLMKGQGYVKRETGNVLRLTYEQEYDFVNRYNRIK